LWPKLLSNLGSLRLMESRKLSLVRTFMPRSTTCLVNTKTQILVKQPSASKIGLQSQLLRASAKGLTPFTVPMLKSSTCLLAVSQKPAKLQ
jgi:hypothetical protein